MAVAFDAVGPSSGGYFSGTTPVTSGSWQHVCTGSNLLLLVDVGISNQPDSGLGVNVSYGGTSMTQIGSNLHSGGITRGFLARFLLINPAAGQHTVSVTVTGGKAVICGGSMSFNGADQSTGVAATTYSATGQSATPTVTVTSNTSGNIIASSAVSGHSYRGIGSGGTKTYSANGTLAYYASNAAGGTWAATGSPVTTSFSIAVSPGLAGDQWAIISNEILPASLGVVVIPAAQIQFTAPSVNPGGARPQQWFSQFSRTPTTYGVGLPSLTPLEIPLSPANTAGWWMFCIVSWRQDAGTPGVLEYPSTVTVSDDAGNFWIPLQSGQPSTGIVRCSVWMAPAARTATTIFISPSSTAAGDAYQSALEALIFEYQGNCPWYSVEETAFGYANQASSLTVSQLTTTTGLFSVGVVASDNNQMPVTVTTSGGWSNLITYQTTNFFDDSGDMQQFPYFATTSGSPMSLTIARASGMGVADLAGVIVTVHGVADTLPYPYGPQVPEGWPELITETGSGPVVNANPLMLGGTANWSVGGNITRDQTATLYAGSGASNVVAWPLNPTAGAKVLLAVAANTSTAPTSVVDNGTTPVTFTLDQSNTAGGEGIYIYRADAITLPASGPYQVTVTFSGSQNCAAMGQSYLGVAAGGPGTAVSNGTGTGTAVSTGAVTPVAANSLFFGAFQDHSGLNPETITLTGAGFLSVLVNTNGSASQASGSADQVTSSSGSQTCTWTLGDSVTWNAAMVAYPQASGNFPAFGTLAPVTWPVYQPYPNYQALITPSIALTPSGSQPTCSLVSEPEPVSQGLRYSTLAFVWSVAGFSTVVAQINWYDSNKNLIGQVQGPQVAVETGEWTQLSFSTGVTPPGNAAYGAAAVTMTAGAALIPSTAVLYIGYCGFGISDSYENVPADNIAWADVSSRNFSQNTIQVSRGIQYEAQSLEAGTMTVTLTNQDGAMMFGNILSSYWPTIGDTDVPIRLRAVNPQSITPYSVMFSGFTDQIIFGWNEEDLYAFAEVEASDAWSRMTSQMLDAAVQEVLEDQPVVLCTCSNTGANIALGNVTPVVSQPSPLGSGSVTASFASNTIALPGASSLSCWATTGSGTITASANQGVGLTYFPPDSQALPPVTGAGVTAEWWFAVAPPAGGFAQPATQLTLATCYSGTGPMWTIYIDNSGTPVNTFPYITVYDQTTGAATSTKISGFAYLEGLVVNVAQMFYATVTMFPTSLTVTLIPEVGVVFPGLESSVTVPANFGPVIAGFSFGGNAGPLAAPNIGGTYGFWNVAISLFSVYDYALPPSRQASQAAIGGFAAGGESDVTRLARIAGYAGATPVTLQMRGWALPSAPAADIDQVTAVTDTNGQVTSSYFTNIASSTLAFMFVNGPGVLVYRRKLEEYDRAIGQWAAGDAAAVPLNSNTLGQSFSVAPWIGENNATLVPASLPSAGPQFLFAGLMTGNGVTANPQIAYGFLGGSQGVTVTPGAWYTMSALYYSPQGWNPGGGGGITIGMVWFTSSFVGISVAESETIPLAAGSVTYLTTGPAQAPWNAAHAFVSCDALGTPPSSVQFYITDVVVAQVPADPAGGITAAVPEVPYLVDSQLSSDRALLYNQAILNQFGTTIATTFQGSGVNFTPTSGVVVTIQDAASVLQRAGVPYTATLYLLNTAQALPYYLNEPSIEDFGNWIVQTLSSPLLRPDQVSITPIATPQALPMALTAEIGDTVTYRRRLPAAPEIQILTYISKLTHTIDISSGQWQTSYELSPFQQGVVLACDDVIHGTLTGGNLLGF